MMQILLAMLDGSTHANVIAPWGKPAPIRLPDEDSARRELLQAHIDGCPADVLYCPRDREPQPMHVERVALAGFCPAADGLARWLGLDLDGSDHGAGGLANPAHAARCVAERAEAAGLSGGLLVARSRGGQGRHMFLFPPAAVPLSDAVCAVAALVARAFRVAAQDVRDYAAPHAFRTTAGRIANPGDSGAVELLPRSTARPAFGWSLALPAAGACAATGGGTILDPFTGTPAEPAQPPRCDPAHWTRFVAEARAHVARRPPPAPARQPAPASGRRPLDGRTESFLQGRAAEGTRAVAAFAATCNLLGAGYPETEARELVLTGARNCGLPEHEAGAAVASAIGTLRRRGKL